MFRNKKTNDWSLHPSHLMGDKIRKWSYKKNEGKWQNLSPTMESTFWRKCLQANKVLTVWQTSEASQVVCSSSSPLWLLFIESRLIHAIYTASEWRNFLFFWKKSSFQRRNDRPKFETLQVDWIRTYNFFHCVFILTYINLHPVCYKKAFPYNVPSPLFSCVCNWYILLNSTYIHIELAFIKSHRTMYM
jgi:hypothetical protein